MKRLVIALLFVSTAASAANKQLTDAFHAAFGKGDSAVLKKQGELKENVKYTPGDLVDAPFGPVLISPGEVLNPAHVNSGKVAFVYLRPSAKGYEVVKKYVPATETGSFGKIGEYSVSKSFGDNPVVSVEGGGTWQGETCSVTTLIELRPDGPKELVSIPMIYDNSGVGDGKALQISGRIDNIKPGKSFDVVYFGSRDFTDHYVRSGDTYTLAAGKKSKMESC
jgi:hypothetical protein